MKTTVDISTPLLAAAKRLAAQRGTTLRELVESGLRRILDDEERAGEFRLRDVSVDGRGLQPAFRDAPWEEVREAAYGSRGG
jgi:hypothetical protein